MSYTPINCAIYDQLLVFTSQKTKVKIVYQVNEFKKTEIDFIKDVYTKEKAEYIVLNSGTEIRLDYIFSINDLELPTNSSCSMSLFSGKISA